MATYVFSKNGMGNYTTGTGMREDMHMQYANIFNYQAGKVLTTDLAVTQRGAGANMSVDVSAGRCFVANSSYTANTANSTKYWGMLSDAVTNLAISTNTSGSTRIDKIVAKIDTTAIANDYATNVGSVIVVEGTPGAGAPATPSNCLLLATLTIPTGTTVSITNAMISNNAAYPGFTLQTFRVSDDGTNAEIITTGDLDITPAGGDFRLKSGTDLEIYNAGNTANAEIAMGTNLDITTTSGDISLTPAGGDVNLTTGTNLVLFNAGDTLSIVMEMSTDFSATLTNNYVILCDQFRVYDSSAGAAYTSLYHDGTNGLIKTGAGDLYLTPAGGDVILNTGTNLVMYNAADTQSFTIDVGTNVDFSNTSGDFDFTPAGGDVRLRDGTDLEIYNAGNTANADISMGTNLDIITTSGDISLAPASNVLISCDLLPATANTRSVGTSSTPFSAVTATNLVLASGSGYLASVDTTFRFAVSIFGGSAGGFDFDAASNNEWIKIPVVAGDPGSLSNGMIWYNSVSNLFKVRENGVTRTM